MKTKNLLSIVIVCAIVIWPTQTFAAPPVTPAGAFGITINLSTNLASGLDAIVAEYNAENANKTNSITGNTNAVTVSQYMNQRALEVIGTYAAKNDAKREEKLILDFRKASPAKQTATENAAK